MAASLVTFAAIDAEMFRAAHSEIVATVGYSETDSVVRGGS
jgi:hypothetical protein